MKRTTIYIATALVAALAAGALAGCSSSSSSSASASASGSASASASASAASESASAASESASASAEAAQSQEELVAEVKNAWANTPEFKSVTVEADTESRFTELDEIIAGKTIYKFDASGDTLKTSAEAEIGDIKLTYFTDGDNAVCVTDGPVYSGTTEQFELSYAAGIDEYIAEEVGDFDTIINCVATVEKTESNGLTAYALKLDPEKYIASDEILTLMAQSGSPVTEAIITISFEEDGSIAAINKAISYEDSSVWTGLMFKDYDSTVIDPMPEATRTYEDMEEDMELKLDALYKQLEAAENSAEAAA